MKTIFLWLICFATLGTAAQDFDNAGLTRLFSFSPISKKVSQVNGMAFGIGHNYKNDEAFAIINGLNLEVNPVTAIIFLLPKSPQPAEHASVIVNGLHLSTGGFLSDGAINGVGISAFDVTAWANGVSVTGLFTISRNLNGVHISGISIDSENGAGLLIAPFNEGGNFTGLQIGALNGGKTVTGLQIGLWNKAEKLKGLQVGLWNKNGKRSLPFINF